MVFYNILLKLYLLLIKAIAPFNSKAALWVKGRDNIFNKLSRAIKNNDQWIWIHCASLGEFEQGRPVLEAIKKDHSDYKILLTFFSPSGYEIRKDFPLADAVFYLPLDSKKAAKQFIDIVNPKIAIFVKYEFWIHYIHELDRRNVPVFLISAIFRPQQIFFKWYGIIFKRLLKKYTHIFVQNQQSAELLKKAGIHHFTIAPDTRFDRVAKIASEAKKIDLIDHFLKDKKAIVAGSTWDKDENMLCKYINKHQVRYKYIIAPHEIDQRHLKSLCEKLSVKAVFYSKASQETDLSKFSVLIIDNIGMLASIYKYAHISYVGGGFGAGIHNVLEPAIYGIPVIFGPNNKKFNEAGELIAEGGAFEIQNYHALDNIFNKLSADQNLYKKTALASKTFTVKNQGGTKLIMSNLTKYL